MEFIREVQTGLTGRHLSHSVLSLRGTRSDTVFPSTSRLAHTGIILIFVRAFRFTFFFFERIFTCLAATQYCDGLRGAFIVDDPLDPHKILYDFDDGMYTDLFIYLGKADSPRIHDHHAFGLASISCCTRCHLSVFFV